MPLSLFPGLIRRGGGKHSGEPPLWKQDRPCTAPPTNLVYLSIGAISNYLHQLEYPSWILERGEKGRKVFQFKVMSFKKKKNRPSNIVHCEPAVASWSPLHAKRISNKGKADTGNTSLWLSGHFQYFISNKESRLKLAATTSHTERRRVA